MKIFVSGSKNVNTLNEEILKVLNRMVENNHEILVGDCDGVDATIQKFMKSKKHNKTNVYYVGDAPRNAQKSFPQIQVKTYGKLSPYEYYQQKDIQMTKDADAGFVIWDEDSKGSKDNILRLLQMNKPVIIYSTKRNKLLKMKTKFERNEVFMNYRTTSGFRKTIYTGRLKPEYIGYFTKEQISQICDNYNYNFGYNVDLKPNGYFTCEIYID